MAGNHCQAKDPRLPQQLRRWVHPRPLLGSRLLKWNSSITNQNPGTMKHTHWQLTIRCPRKLSLHSILAYRFGLLSCNGTTIGYLLQGKMKHTHWPVAIVSIRIQDPLLLFQILTLLPSPSACQVVTDILKYLTALFALELEVSHHFPDCMLVVLGPGGRVGPHPVHGLSEGILYHFWCGLPRRALGHRHWQRLQTMYGIRA